MASPSRTCFVVGPIGKRGSRERKHADALFVKIIKPAADSLKRNLHVVRADHIFTPGMIDSQIVTHLLEAKLVIADLTTRNPNAFYELGIRHMANKPVIHVYKRGEKIPSDVSLFRAVEISYASAVAIGKSRANLAKAIRETLLKGYVVESPVTQSRGFQRLLRPLPRKPLKSRRSGPTLRSGERVGGFPPHIQEAANLVWRARPGGIWEARWQAPYHLVKQGFNVRSVRIWHSSQNEPMTSEDRNFIRDATRQLQSEVEKWVEENQSS